MTILTSLLTVVHLLGLALAVGASTVKSVLLLKCGVDPAFVPAFVKVVRLVTRQIVLGLILLTLSGVSWLLLGYGFTPLLVAKLALVAAIWVIGPVIDGVVEPRFLKLASVAGEKQSIAFRRIWAQLLALEVLATLLFYVIVVMWVLR